MDGIKLIVISKMLHQCMHMTRSKHHRQLCDHVKMTLTMVVQNIRRTVVIPMLVLIPMGVTHEHFKP